MQRSTKINLSIVAGLAVAATVAAAVLIGGASRPDPRPSSSTVAAPEVEAPDSRVLDDPAGAEVTLVEFLDFECEVCGAVYPYVEEIRSAYAGELRVVQRYFPIPGHRNSMTSAVAVEAAAQQGAYEPMYHRMFETQAQWGEQQESKAALFREFAAELGLDLEAYDAAVADPATEARVQADFDAGLALGVQGTPTFFVDGVRVELRTVDDLTDALDAALGR